MDDQATGIIEPEVPPLAHVVGEEQTPPDDLLDQLRQKRQELSGQQEVDIIIPGYDQKPPILIARYRLMEGKELQRIGDNVYRQVKDRLQRQLLAGADVCIAACVGMYVDHGDNQPRPLTKDGMQIPGYNADLASALGFTAEKARDVFFGVFVNNDVAIADHVMRLNRWMTNTSSEVDADFLGNL